MLLAEIFKQAGKKPADLELVDELQRNFLISEVLINLLESVSRIYECADTYAELFRQEQRRAEYSVKPEDLKVIYESEPYSFHRRPTLEELREEREAAAVRASTMISLMTDIDRLIESY